MPPASRRHARCEACDTYRDIIADLRGLLASSEADRKQMTDRLLALMFPQALQVARGDARPTPKTQTSGYDPEVGHERLVDGEEQLMGGKIDPREWSEVQDLLATMNAGQPPPDITDTTTNGNGHEGKHG